MSRNNTYRLSWQSKQRLMPVHCGNANKTNIKNNSINFNVIYLEPVSYTHLDVYKRQGQQFTNTKWHSELEKHGIQTVLTAIRRPQGNLAERVNKELGRLFRPDCNVNQSKWPEFLEFFESAINGNYNSTTGYTPNELQTGAMPGRIWEGHIERISTQNVPIPVEIKKLEARRRIKKCAEERTETFNVL